MDGIDAVLVSFTHLGKARLEQTFSQPYPDALRAALIDLAGGEQDRLHQLATLDRQLAYEFARAALGVIDSAGCDRDSVVAIGSHGQTVRHHPLDDPTRSYSLQIGDPAGIAELTGISTVADFRRQDIAAGGQGAPLVPLFHATQFGDAGQCRAVINIGGISNLSLIDDGSVIAGFDCGPGNTLLDAWVRRHRGEAFDAFGAWSAEHSVIPALLTQLQGDTYFSREGPRSTGPEHFNLEWLEQHLSGTENPGDVQATLAELTACAIIESIRQEPKRASAAFICGGGARNTDLMRRLHRQASSLDLPLGTTDDLGLAAEWVEAAAFAWLAKRRLEDLPGNAPLVTGASGERTLGAVYPAPRR